MHHVCPHAHRDVMSVLSYVMHSWLLVSELCLTSLGYPRDGNVTRASLGGQRDVPIPGTGHLRDGTAQTSMGAPGDITVLITKASSGYSLLFWRAARLQGLRGVTGALEGVSEVCHCVVHVTSRDLS